MADGYTAEEAAYNKRYYEEHKKLVGREGGSSEPVGTGKASPAKTPPPADRATARAAAAQRVSALKAKLSSLKQALAAAKAKSKASADKAPKEGTAEADSKKKAENKKYYEENKSKIAAKAVANAKGGGSSSKSESSSSSSGTRSVADIEAAIRTTLGELKTAIAKLKTL